MFSNLIASSETEAQAAMTSTEFQMSETMDSTRFGEGQETVRFGESRGGFGKESSKTGVKKTLTKEEADQETHEEWTEEQHFGFEETRTRIIGNYFLVYAILLLLI